MTTITLHDYHHQINQLLENNRTREAAAHCRHILGHYPRHVGTYRALAQALLELGENESAIDLFHRVLSTEPNDFISHLGLAIIFEEQSSLARSIWHMERAFEMKPYDPIVQKKLRDLYSQNDIPVPKRLPLTRGALARLYLRGELYQQAASELRTLLAQDEERIDLELLLAEALWRDDKRVDSVDVCRKILEKLPNCIIANAILAEIWLVTGRKDEAQEFLLRLSDLTQAEAGHIDGDSPVGRAFGANGAKYLPDKVEIEYLEESSPHSSQVEADRPSDDAGAAAERDDTDSEGMFGWLRDDVFAEEELASDEMVAEPSMDSIPAMESLWLVDEAESELDETAVEGDLPDWLGDVGIADDEETLISEVDIDATKDLSHELEQEFDQALPGKEFGAIAPEQGQIENGAEAESEESEGEADRDDAPDWLAKSSDSEFEPIKADPSMLESSWFGTADSDPVESVDEVREEREGDEDADWLELLDQASEQPAEPFEFPDLPLDDLPDLDDESALPDWLSEEAMVDAEPEPGGLEEEESLEPLGGDEALPDLEADDLILGEDGEEEEGTPAWLMTGLFDTEAGVDMVDDTFDSLGLDTDVLSGESAKMPEWLKTGALEQPEGEPEAEQFEASLPEESTGDPPAGVGEGETDIPEWLSGDAFDTSAGITVVDEAVQSLGLSTDVLSPEEETFDVLSDEEAAAFLEPSQEEIRAESAEDVDMAEKDRVDVAAEVLSFEVPDLATNVLGERAEEAPEWLDVEQFDTPSGLDVVEDTVQATGLSTDVLSGEETNLPDWLPDGAEDVDSEEAMEKRDDEGGDGTDEVERREQAAVPDPEALLDSEELELVDEALTSGDTETPAWLQGDPLNTAIGENIVEETMDTEGLFTDLLPADELSEDLQAQLHSPLEDGAEIEEILEELGAGSEEELSEETPDWLQGDPLDTMVGMDVVEETMDSMGLSTAILAREEVPDELKATLEEQGVDQEGEKFEDEFPDIGADLGEELDEGTPEWLQGDPLDTMVGLDVVSETMDSMGLYTDVLKQEALPDWLQEEDIGEPPLGEPAEIESDIAELGAGVDQQVEEETPEWLQGDPLDTMLGQRVVEDAVDSLGLTTDMLSREELPDWLQSDDLAGEAVGDTEELPSLDGDVHEAIDLEMPEWLKGDPLDTMIGQRAIAQGEDALGFGEDAAAEPAEADLSDGEATVEAMDETPIEQPQMTADEVERREEMIPDWLDDESLQDDPPSYLMDQITDIPDLLIADGDVGGDEAADEPDLSDQPMLESDLSFESAGEETDVTEETVSDAPESDGLGEALNWLQELSAEELHEPADYDGDALTGQEAKAASEPMAPEELIGSVLMGEPDGGDSLVWLDELAAGEDDEALEGTEADKPEEPETGLDLPDHEPLEEDEEPALAPEIVADQLDLDESESQFEADVERMSWLDEIVAEEEIAAAEMADPLATEPELELVTEPDLSVPSRFEDEPAGRAEISEPVLDLTEDTGTEDDTYLGFEVSDEEPTSWVEDPAVQEDGTADEMVPGPEQAEEPSLPFDAQPGVPDEFAGKEGVAAARGDEEEKPETVDEEVLSWLEDLAADEVAEDQDEPAAEADGQQPEALEPDLPSDADEDAATVPDDTVEETVDPERGFAGELQAELEDEVDSLGILDGEVEPAADTDADVRDVEAETPVEPELGVYDLDEEAPAWLVGLAAGETEMAEEPEPSLDSVLEDSRVEAEQTTETDTEAAILEDHVSDDEEDVAPAMAPAEELETGADEVLDSEDEIEIAPEAQPEVEVLAHASEALEEPDLAFAEADDDLPRWLEDAPEDEEAEFEPAPRFEVGEQPEAEETLVDEREVETAAPDSFEVPEGVQVILDAEQAFDPELELEHVSEDSIDGDQDTDIDSALDFPESDETLLETDVPDDSTLDWLEDLAIQETEEPPDQAETDEPEAEPEAEATWVEVLTESPETGDVARESDAIELSADMPEAGASEEGSDVPEDLDDAMAWLEQLASKQGAPLEELPSLADSDAAQAVPEKDAAPEEALETPEDTGLAEVLGEPALEVEPEDDAETPEDLDEAMEWLEELAARQEAPFEELPTVAVEIEAADSLEPEPGAAIEADPASPAMEFVDESTDIADDLDDAMVWLEGLAAQQMADVGGFAAQADEEMSAEEDQPVEVAAELPDTSGRPKGLEDALDWLGQLFEAEESAAPSETEDAVIPEMSDQELGAALDALAVLAETDPAPVEEALQIADETELAADEHEPETLLAAFEEPDDGASEFAETTDGTILVSPGESAPDAPTAGEATAEDARVEAAEGPDLHAEQVAESEMATETAEETIQALSEEDQAVPEAIAPQEPEREPELDIQPTFGADEDAVFELSVGVSEGVLEDGFLDDLPDDPEAALAWLEEFVEEGGGAEEAPIIMESADAEFEAAAGEMTEADQQEVEYIEAGSQIVVEEPKLPGDGQAELDSPAAASLAATLDDELLDEMPADPDEAVAWLQRFAEQGEASGDVADASEETRELQYDVSGEPSLAGEENGLTDSPLDFGDHLFDDIPEDPDEAMAWLEEISSEVDAMEEDDPSLAARVDAILPDGQFPQDLSRRGDLEETTPLADDDVEQETTPHSGETGEEIGDAGLQFEDEVADSLPEWLMFEQGEEERTKQTDWLRSLPEPDVAGWLEDEEEATISGVYDFDATLQAESRVDTGPLIDRSQQDREDEELVLDLIEEDDFTDPVDIDESQLTLARQTLMIGDDEEAVEAYRSLVEKGRGLSTLIDDLETATRRRTGTPDFQRLLGDAYLRNGQLQKALDNYREALDSI